MPAKKTTRKTPRQSSSSKNRTARKAAVQTGFTLPPDELERALLTGESRGLLEDYFGPESYSQLRDLARDAATRSVRGGPRVLILPGIMGSTLARKGPLGIEDVLWINPVEIAVGRLSNLKLDGEASPYHASGVILLAYLRLKLRLKTAGFNADFFPFDWRRSLSEIAANLANAIEQDPAVQVSLVAHSMGGLAARIALRSAGAKVVRLIMLGTPNYGSFAPVQVIRATDDVIHKVAALDLRHTAEQLSNEVFNTFPGLYEMLPAPEKFSAVDLYVAGSWPHRGPQPRADLLSKVKSVRNDLAPADSRFFLIAGVNQTTVVGLHPGTAEFQYELSSDGDGTVPVAFAELANMSEEQIYYVEESHGSLPNNGFVEVAVVDLLSSGTTSALANQRPATRGAAETVSEKRVREMAQRAAGIGQLGTADYRHLLDSVAAAPRVEQAAERIALPPTAAAAAQGAGGLEVKLTQHFQNLTIGKRSQRRIELTLAHGSITDVDSRAYVLGVFRNVAPSGPATPIDRRLDGAVTEFTARRMLGGDVGSVFMIPVGRNQLAADMVLFLGLGPFDRFNADVQQLVSENVIRLLVRSRVDEFATILIGAGSGQSASAVVQNLLVGFFRGLHDADPRRRFRGLTLCEADPARFAEMRAEVYRLAGTSLFDEIELDLTEIEVPPTEPVAARVLEAGQEPVYMMIRQEGHTPNHLLYRVSVLGSGMKAAVVTAAKDIDQKKLAELLNKFDTAVGPNSSFKDVQSFGRQFSELLPREICTVLESMRDRHIVVVHDTEAARIPWETLTINDWSPALGAGLSRRYLADNLPVATWLEERRVQPILRLLLIVNPLGDLGGAEREGDRVLQLAKTDAGISVTPLRQKEASKAAVLAALRSGLYDCVHYAGHAFFDPQGPGRSGLLCAGQEVLRGADLAGISNLPSLVFFNACEAGRVRGKLAKPSKKASEQAFESAGVAEALMRGGIANYMSTYWPVGDDAAETFAATFYKGALAGRTIGSALLEGRKNVQELGVRDWADYMLYGSFDFILKQSE